MKSAYVHKAIVILLFLVFIIQSTYSCAQTNMQAIQFIPKEFSDVESKFDTNERHSLTPFYPHFVSEFNDLAINVPQKIIIRAMDSSSKLIIPLCGFCSVSIKRAMKYAEQEAYLIHIKKVEAEDWFCGEIWKPARPYNMEEEPVNEEERQIEIEKAQSYTDDELDEGGGAAEAFNVDVLKFVQFVPEPGIYEIYVSTVGLESNHMQIEIAIEK
ncbi:hypothetical protein [Ancylomarina sp. 16SWW S1-10-2]|uniref:hypothetical protein n=1 Tax=Ancylomarina sp. 16SWW S1-10-2 TaxID=2499681 RepID=UPI0012AD4C40|nr:hypothetical protein [Ancylomarina sp. 16SWW S1-10-2]MRT92833.1 hypothetical protein [Ancylomarina sp. 16SWW S1-10-2]